MFGGNNNPKTNNQPSTEARGGAAEPMGGEDRLFKRSNIVKDRDIEELGQKAERRANNDDTSESPSLT